MNFLIKDMPKTTRNVLTMAFIYSAVKTLQKLSAIISHTENVSNFVLNDVANLVAYRYFCSVKVQCFSLITNFLNNSSNSRFIHMAITKKQAECIVFPDIHGRDFWKKVLEGGCEWDASLYIFLGDYFDPYPSEGITPAWALMNWHDMNLTLKEHGDKEIVFLLGNHDAHYMNEIFQQRGRGSRFSRQYCDKIRQLLSKVPLRLAYEMSIGENKILFTHAGVTYPWYLQYKDLIGTLNADNLNALTNSDEGWLALCDTSFYRGGGQAYGSPLWADCEEFTNDAIKIGYDLQIVGHNQLETNEPAVFGNIVDLDCHHPFALTSDLELIKL